MRRLLLFLTLMMLPGCAFLPKESIVASTNDYNLAVERAQNEMLLLNIVRASKRRPLYFTGFNLMRGNISSSVSTGSLTIPFGRIGTGFNGAYSIAPGISASTNPSFDVGILDTKEFIRGIMTPVSMETIAYYWNEDWPKEMLLYLFVEKVEKAGKTLQNTPGNSEGFAAFREWASKAKSCTISTQEKPLVGPAVKIGEDIDVSKLIDIHKNGMTLVPVDATKGTYKLTYQKPDYVMECNNDNRVMQIKVTPNGAEAGIDRLFLRSPEGMIYYLGEVLRAKVDHGYDTKFRLDRDREALLFDAQPIEMDTTGFKPVIRVDYEGKTYVVPDGDGNRECRPSRSTQTLALLSELISLQKSGENLPTTGVVNILGR